MANSNRKKNRQRRSVSPNAPLAVSQTAPPSSGDLRRDQLMQQVNAASEAVARESRTGFGKNSIAANQALEQANRNLRDYEASQDTFGKAYKMAVNIGMPIAGMYAGHKIADSINAKHTAAVTSRNKEIVKAANRAEPVMKKGWVNPAGKNKLKGIVQAADKLGLDRVKGPLGLATGALLVGEGLVLRTFVAPQVDNEQAKELLRSAGTASVFAATSLVGQRVVQNATQKTIPPAAALSVIEQARVVVEGSVKAAAPSARSAIKTAIEVSKKSAVSKALKVVGKGALRVATPVVVGLAAAAAYNTSARAGERKTTSLSKGATAAVDSIAMNVPSEANKALKKSGHGSVPEFISNTLLQAFGQRPRNTLPRHVPTQNKPLPRLSARGSANPTSRIASAGRFAPSGLNTTKVKAHFKDRGGKGIFTKAHVRINTP